MLLFVVCCLLLSVCCCLFAAVSLLLSVCCSLLAAGCLLLLALFLLLALGHTPDITFFTSPTCYCFFFVQMLVQSHHSELYTMQKGFEEEYAASNHGANKASSPPLNAEEMALAVSEISELRGMIQSLKTSVEDRNSELHSVRRSSTIKIQLLAEEKNKMVRQNEQLRKESKEVQLRQKMELLVLQERQQEEQLEHSETQVAQQQQQHVDDELVVLQRHQLTPSSREERRRLAASPTSPLQGEEEFVVRL